MGVPNKQLDTTEEAMRALWYDRLRVCSCSQCVRLAGVALGEEWAKETVQEIRDAIRAAAMPKVRKKTT